ncbi:MAG: LysR family transcriptional regulator [Burkholderiales bacterium]
MDYLTSLRVFKAVADTGSFVAAAGTLRFSRAAVTKHVNHLEDRLGTRLLQRTTRRVALTEAGARFHERCTHVLADLEEAERDATQVNVEPRGTLRVNLPYAFGTAHVAPLLAEFHRTCPSLRLELWLNDRFVDLIEEGFDLAIRISEALPPSSLVARKLATCRFVVCGAPGYFVQHGEPRAPDELRIQACLGYALSSPLDHDWNFVCPESRRHVVRVDGMLRSNSVDLLRAATVAGAGVAVLPSFVVGDDLKGGRLKAVLTEYALPVYGVYAVYPSRKHLSAKVKAFVEFLAAKYGPAPYWDEWLRALPPPTKDACVNDPEVPVLRPRLEELNHAAS